MKCILGGVSVQGLHDVNQDSFQYSDFGFGQILVLSDGLGSRKHSDVGSRSFCNCVVELAKETRCSVEAYGDINGFLAEIHRRWLASLDGHEVKDCYCTALFVMIKSGLYISAHLGDGVIVVMADGKAHVSLEEKESFSNITNALTENFVLEDWCVEKCNFDVMEGVYLSSDGVELKEYKDTLYADFARDFCMGYEGMSCDDIESHIKDWLIDWPSNDDKTIVFLISEQLGD